MGLVGTGFGLVGTGYVYICVYMCIYAYICVYMCIYVYIWALHWFSGPCIGLVGPVQGLVGPGRV